MENVSWKVEGMSCTNCALTIHKYLEEKGVDNVKVNFIGGEVNFDLNDTTKKTILLKGIESLGYHVKNETIPAESKATTRWNLRFTNHGQRFLFCAVFTLPLMLDMFVHSHFLMNPYVQLALTLPVYWVGIKFFGKSAIKSLRNGIPNMNVLIALGATAAFIYSLYGMLIGRAADFMFFETTAAIITLVFLGNWLEDKSVETTQKAIRSLAITQKTKANMIAFDDQHQEQIFQVESESLRVGDLILINSGEPVPMDCKILWGEAKVNESLLTGESIPVQKTMKDLLIGGSTLESGTVKAQVTAVGKDTVLSNILNLVKQAQAEKPPVQQLADKISAIFVPTVISIAMLTLIGNYFFTDIGFGNSLLRGIAVLVISCPCAMGLATPAAIAVGLGRAAKNGILFKNARSLEVFKDIQQVVFDKTGTLTTGHFSITQFETNIDINTFQSIVASLEKYAAHPIAKAIVKEWKPLAHTHFTKVEEIKGLGMKGVDAEGNVYMATSYKQVADLTTDHFHNVYITKNNAILGWLDVEDTIRPEAVQVMQQLHQKNIRTILLSGDSQANCEKVAAIAGIDTVFGEQTPEQKLQTIARLTTQAPTAMIGDGINDAPALAKATVGISLSDASHIAMQSAQVVLMNHGLTHLPLALGLGKHTYQTIRENLFWAFFYNIIAIPIAAFGYLNPAMGALAMGLSDVVLAINSVRLNYKKVV
ncbi:MAG: cadmium-translocating P-type ATPase [Sphingobacteriales bacterium]|uniref:heavy metal translocating P-type ATPase n=1 Tax=Hydrotalea flava TaxID=714549 RepID=UPI00082D6747|nr:cation-translocating P-type ATPase [Hydrotalea flava]RTL51507.1 MAG: cadmium-translocating P-type ATPase [Sphingobacteriales bacterium]